MRGGRMFYHEMKEALINAIYDAMQIIKKIYPGHALRYMPYVDPEGGGWMEGFIEIAGITAEDCKPLQVELWKDINKRDGIHIITEPWYDFNDSDKLPGQK